MMKFWVFILCILVFSMLSFSQTKSESWSLGSNLGINNNYISMGYQNLSKIGGDFIPTIYFDGFGISPYLSIFYEYNSNSFWSTELRLSYDNKSGKVYDNYLNKKSEFNINMSYFGIEPILKFNNLKSSALSLYTGIQFLFLINSKYDNSYNAVTEIKDSTISFMNPAIFGVILGTSYDFETISFKDKTKFLISPFFETSWIFNQRESTLPANQNTINDIWSTTSFKIGLKLSFNFPYYDNAILVKDKKTFETDENNNLTVSTGQNGNFKIRKVEEYFPLIPYVFFDKNSDELPLRYTLIDRESAINFNEKDLLSINPKIKLKEYHFEQFKAYYNILNIYADRMRKNPNVSLLLVGSDPYFNKGIDLAERVKKYFVDVFGIKPNLILVEGRQFPNKPSTYQNATSNEKIKLDIENRRVEFIFNDKLIYDPVILNYVSESQLDNDLEFILDENSDIKNWSVNFNNLQRTQTFGPFEENYIRIDPLKIMKGINESNFEVQVNFFKNDNSSFNQTKTINLKKVLMPDNDIVHKYYLIRLINDNTVLNEQDWVYNKIKNFNFGIDFSVFLHSHTDDIGNDKNNTIFSLKESQKVETILKQILPKRTNFYPIGFGELYMHSYFDNNTPEGRIYNRNTTIEILNKEKK